MKQESKEIVETKKQELAVLTASDSAMWQNDEVSSNDIIIPRILAMQGLSQFVTEGKARFGDFVNSLSEEVLGGIGKPITFIPFYVQKLLKVSKEVSGKFELLRWEPLTPLNENLEWEDIEGNFKIRREHVYNCFSIIPGQILPVLISLKGKSKKAGKKVITQMYAINMSAKKIAPCSTVMSLSGKSDKNDKGTFVVMDVSNIGDATKDQIAECAKWISIVKSGGAKVATEEEESEGSPTAAPSNTEF